MILDHRGNPIHAAGYNGAIDTRQRNKQTFRRSLPYDEDNLIGQYDLDVLKQECLDLRRNNAIVAGVVERFSDHVVGPEGIHPQAKTDDPEWNDAAEWYWYEWAKIADFRQRVNLRELQRLAVQSRLMAGDCGFVILSNGQLQPVESPRIRTPTGEKPDANITHGVKLNKSGIAQGYYVHQRDSKGVITGKNYEFVESQDMIFVSRPMRFDQVRGIPELAPVLNAVTDFGRLQEEVLNKAILDAMHAWAVYSEAGAAGLPNVGPRSYDTTADSNGRKQKYEYFAGGQTYYMQKGEKVESLASNTPNPQYVEYSELLLRIIASALCIPYEFLVLDFKQGSFSASRAALMTTYRTFSMWQSWLIDSFLQRTWNWRIAKAIKAGELKPAPVGKNGVSQWYRVQWATPRYDWIDPQAEAIKNIYNVALGVDSVSTISTTRGGDIEDVQAQKKKDYITAGRNVVETNAELKKMGIKDEVTLEHFIQVKVPPGINNNNQQALQDQQITQGAKP